MGEQGMREKGESLVSRERREKCLVSPARFTGQTAGETIERLFSSRMCLLRLCISIFNLDKKRSLQ